MVHGEEQAAAGAFGRRRPHRDDGLPGRGSRHRAVRGRLSAAAVVDRLETLSQYARDLLLGPYEPVEAPIRAELFGAQRFEQHGHSLARAQVVRSEDSHGDATPFFPQVDRNLEALRSAFDYIALISQSGRYVTPAAEWLLDNFHLVEAQLQQIREGVPRSYYARLPKLAAPPLAGLPRVYGIAWAYVAHTDSVLNQELFTAFLNAYQDIDELTLGELWALPTTLRVVLLENLRRVAEGIAESKVAREVAHAAWDAADTLSGHDLDVLLPRAAKPRDAGELSHPALAATAGRARGRRTAAPEVDRAALPQRPGARSATRRRRQAAANLTVGNIITTLRMIGQVEWADLIEPVSRSLRVLRELPSFTRESELTRQQITHAMEQVARTSRRSEREVAQAVERLARDAASDSPADEDDETRWSRAERTAGYYLFGQGLPALSVALAPADGSGAARIMPRLSALRAWRPTLYVLAVLAGTALLLGTAVHGLNRSGWPEAPWQAAVALVLLVFPLSEAVIALVHRIMAESTRVQPLPRLDFAQGIPEAHRVLVAIPALLSSQAANAQLAHRLELHWLANREAHAQFALLTDWADAAEAKLPGDDALLDDAQRRIAALNARYPAPPGAAAALRAAAPAAQLERDRAALDGLGAQARQARDAAAPAGRGRRQRLPADGARLSPGRAHPLRADARQRHRPAARRAARPGRGGGASAQCAADRRGQPPRGRAASASSSRASSRPSRRATSASLFHWLFAGQCGLDPYSSSASDLYQDVFGSGSFTGKGLLNVRAVHATLDRRLPDGAVLSHDLLEGAVARCGVVSDLVLIEDHPHHAGVAASRVHRWTRGDWQLLPLMLRARRFGIDALGLWKMSDNLRRALVMPASTALLAWVVFTDAFPLHWALAAVAAALHARPHARRAGRPGADAALDRAAPFLRRRFHRAAARHGRRGLAVRPARRAEPAPARRHGARRLAARGERAGTCSNGPRRPRPRRRPATAWRPSCATGRSQPWPASRSPSPRCAVRIRGWACCCSGCGRWRRSRPGGAAACRRGDDDALDAEHRSYLETLARDTWGFFVHAVGPDDNHLPPDNLQFEPEPTIAHRTSPTNIGMYLLASCCAREFGWLDTAALAARLEATLDTVDRMDKHQGHLYNWYDTQSLEDAAAGLRVQRRQRQLRGPPAGRGPGLPQLRGRRQRRRRRSSKPLRSAARPCARAWISAGSTTPSGTCSTSACASRRTCSTPATTTCSPPSRGS